jgi:predicted ATPase
MKDCTCNEPHARRRIVLTGGPGAGKTAVLELIRHSLCKHLRIVPEAAGVLFGGGFPRGGAVGERRAAQRAIYFVQRELEASIESADVAIALCDRGTVDGEAYWPGPGELWTAVETTREAELRRYDAVIHLRTPQSQQGYNRTNPLRIELADEALAIDAKIAAAWASHPHCYTVESSAQFLDKASRAIAILRDEMPDCCRRHIGVPQLSGV